MSTIPFTANRASLYTPGEATDLFEYGSAQTESEPALCAEMARLAYVKELSRLENYLHRAKFDLAGSIGYNTSGTQVFFAKAQNFLGKSTAVIAFRGTESDDPSDMVSDAHFLKTSWKAPSGADLGSVHAGFAQALLENNGSAVLNEILDHIERLTDKSCRILLTGHSLGAALATLVASYLSHTEHAKDMHLYTFGSPLVGDEAFACCMMSVDYTRYVGCCDLVTRVPPEAFGYQHVGSLRYINSEGLISNGISENDILSDRALAAAAYLIQYSFLPGTAWIRELADHSPINYVSAVSNLRSKPGG